MQGEEHAAKPGTPFAARLPPTIPDHEMLCVIGRGAYGEVWMARNAIGTPRAVKIVHRQSFQRAEHFEREFKGLLKFEPISRSHDGLVDVLQIGRRDDAGYFFYIMELADAARSPGEDGELKIEDATGSRRGTHHPPNYQPRTLRSELRSHGRLPPAECVKLGLKLASALEHLHTNGLVHRDIKPLNIIFVNGEPKLADIGLVTAIDDTQSLVGTAGYSRRKDRARRKLISIVSAKFFTKSPLAETVKNFRNCRRICSRIPTTPHCLNSTKLFSKPVNPIPGCATPAPRPWAKT